MTVTYDTNTDQFTIESTNLSDFGVIDTAVLTSKINCGDTEYSVEILVGDVAANQYTIDNSAFYGVTELADAVYSFVLTVTKTDESIVQEVNCYFVDNETGCDVAELVQSEGDLQLQLDYYILSNATDCKCNCDALCAIYKRIAEYESDNCGDCSGC